MKGKKQFMGVFFRDKISDKHRRGYYVLRMLMTVWVVIHIGLLSTTKEIIKCLDSFGLTCPKELMKGSNTVKPQLCVARSIRIFQCLM